MKLGGFLLGSKRVLFGRKKKAVRFATEQTQGLLRMRGIDGVERVDVDILSYDPYLLGFLFAYVGLAITAATQNTLDSRSQGEAISSVITNIFGEGSKDLLYWINRYLEEKDESFALGAEKATKVVLIAAGKWDDFDDDDYRLAINGAADTRKLTASILGGDGGSGFAAASNVLLMKYWINSLPP